MNYLLKIVQGANAGAEIALAEGVVTFGSADTCDIVLADATLPAEAFALETTDAGVSVRALPDGEAKKLDLYTLFTFGNSSFAVGENGVAWPEVKAPAPPAPPPPEPSAETPDAETESPAPPPAPAPEAPPPAAEPQRHGLGCIPVLLLLLLFFLAGFLVSIYLTRRGIDIPFFGRPDAAREAAPAQPAAESAAEPAAADASEKSLAGWAAEHGVSVSEKDGETVLFGNFAKRADRLSFAQEAYARESSLVLDLSDDETLRAGVEEVLFVLSEGRTKLDMATNRVVKLAGRARTREELLNTVAAICTDVNRVRVVDDTAVVCEDGLRTQGPTRYQALSSQAARKHPFATPAAKPGMPPPKCPVAGVILMPYPCLVLRDGSRAAEGSVVGDFKVEKIEADKVTLRRGEETVTWKP